MGFFKRVAPPTPDSIGKSFFKKKVKEWNAVGEAKQAPWVREGTARGKAIKEEFFGKKRK